jgi:selenocysteine lyase/cysteine desulfurase
MSEKRRIYLDHAATSWPKSPAVMEAMQSYLSNCGAAAGRGGYQAATTSDAIVATVRRQIATMIRASESNSVSLHSNGTAALNAAIHGVLRPGDHVVTNASEHNSVLRPLHFLAERGVIQLSIVACDKYGVVDAADLIAATGPKTRLVTMTHASNVTGAVQPIEPVAHALRDSATMLLVDAAQTFGTLPIDVTIGIDLLAAPGHKSSGGPLGTAFLYVAPAIHGQMTAFMQGGTGSQSESLAMPVEIPSMLESGNLNVHALAGWAAALEELRSEGIVRRREMALSMSEQMHTSLSQVPHLHLFSRPGPLPIVSLSVQGLEPTDAAVILDAEFGVETRAGFHCAALIHGYLGSEETGTLRLSAGHTSGMEEVEAATDAVAKLVATLHP